MIHRLLSALALILLAVVGARAELAGTYNGVDAAEGMRLDFEAGGDRPSGVFMDRSGERHPFTADPLETGGETIIDRGGQRLYMLFTEEPLGLTMVVIPMTERDELITNRADAFVFIKQGVAPPPKPARYVPPPQGPGGVIDPQAFVEGYPFWPSVNVGYGYEMVRGRYRTLLRLHPLVVTDMLWKMCRAGSSPAGLAEALRGQGADCQDVLSTFAKIMRPGGGITLYNRYRKDVEAERARLVEAIRCSADYRRNDPDCLAVGKEIAERAISLETVKTVLDRY